LASCLLLFWPVSVGANEQIIIAVTLNQQPKGDFFVLLGEDGDFLIPVADLEAMGFARLPGTPVDIQGVSFFSLSSLQGVEYKFDENTLTIELTSAPELLPKTTLDLSPQRRPGVIYPRDNSLFLNYGIDYSAGGDDDFVFEGLTVSNELGMRFRDLLLLTNSVYSETPDDSQFVRLNSSVTWDDRQTLRRVIGGDFFALSGDLGSRMQMGGLSISKLYRIDPYFIRYPLFDFSGMASLPSDVDLYVDGVRVRSERFAPGEFELLNFQSLGGAQTIEVVIRDAFGREQRIASPFFFTDRVLRQGLHEYSYNLGLQRRDFGQESNSYSDLAFSAFHRYGLSDNLNLGLRGEAADDLANLGVEAVMKTGGIGLLRLEVSGSSAGDDSGAAGFLGYEYYNRRFRGRLALQGFSEGYRTLSDKVETATRRKLRALAGIGYTTPQFGSFSVDYARNENYDEPQRETLTFSWSRRLWKRAYVNATYRQIRETATSHETGVNLTWYLGREHSLTTALRREGSDNIQMVEARKNTPSGAGTGWNVRAERADREGSRTDQLNAVVQHNARHAILRGDVSAGRSKAISSEDLRLSLSGALVQVGDTFALTRPVTDSFALVSVGDIEGVGVYVNGQTSGRTNSKGKVVIPDLSSYYDNQVSIEDKDIPIDYLMPRVRLNISPPLRSGSCLNFPLRKYQAFTGFLNVDGQEGVTPLAYAELDLATATGPVKFWTGSDGEFYIDSQEVEFDLAAHQGCEALTDNTTAFLPAGTYPLTVKLENDVFQSELTIPESDETFAELGTLTLPVLAGSPIEQAPATDQPPASETEQASVEPEASIHETNQANELTEASPPFATETSPQVAVEAKQESAQPDQQAVDDTLPLFTILFPLDSSIPLPTDQSTLDQALNYLLEHPERPIDIEGHADQQGSAAYNQKLGYWRAQALRDYLVTAGINPQRFNRIVSYGESKPLCRDTSEECLSQNRRAIVLVAITPEN
jgi:outer membrane usher protein FimD/PapC/outer membrane protein OmpA-like peptidoglycan-associated protein